jgi:hypothetical protein
MKYDSNDTIFFIRYFYNMTIQGFQGCVQETPVPLLRSVAK